MQKKQLKSPTNNGGEFNSSSYSSSSYTSYSQSSRGNAPAGYNSHTSREDLHSDAHQKTSQDPQSQAYSQQDSHVYSQSSSKSYSQSQSRSESYSQSYSQSHSQSQSQSKNQSVSSSESGKYEGFDKFIGNDGTGTIFGGHNPIINSVDNFKKLKNQDRSLSPLVLNKGSLESKYLFVHIHDSLHNTAAGAHLTQQLHSAFPDSMDFSTFKDSDDLLKTKFKDLEMHYIFTGEEHMTWAKKLARQERQLSKNKKLLYVYGLLDDKSYAKRNQKREHTRRDKIDTFVNFFPAQNTTYGTEIIRQMQSHCDERNQKAIQHVKTWALSNKFKEKQMKRATVHLYVPHDFDHLSTIYQNCKSKSHSSWFQIYRYERFDDIMLSICDREQNLTSDYKQVLANNENRLKENTNLGATGVSRSGVPPLPNEKRINDTVTRALHKLNKNDRNFIVLNENCSEREMNNYRSLVRLISNWTLWEIKGDFNTFDNNLRELLQDWELNANELEDKFHDRVIKSKNFYVLAKSDDTNTINMFNRHKNVYAQMELLLYQNESDFQALLIDKIKHVDDFVFAVVPGNSRSIDSKYLRVKNEFESRYQYIDTVENYKFITNYNGKHVSNVPVSASTFQSKLKSAASRNSFKTGTSLEATNFKLSTTNIPSGTNLGQTNLGLSLIGATIQEKPDQILSFYMDERDKYFDPLRGLKGNQVYILVKQNKAYLVDELRGYIQENPRLVTSTYIDNDYLSKQLKTIQIKDSAIIIADDSSLREAQEVATKFDEVFILHVTDRENVKKQVKVLASGRKDDIYDYVKSIPQADNLFFDDQDYGAMVPKSDARKDNRIPPKSMYTKPADIVTIRIPAALEDEDSAKMEVRLMKYFDQKLKMEYYENPKDVRFVNKLEEPLSYIICQRDHLDYMKSLAIKEKEELREEFILYDQSPDDFPELLYDESLERFKFVSNSWADIEDYIKKSTGKFKGQADPDSIDMDATVRVFVNEKSSTNIIETVFRQQNPNRKVGANYINFHKIEDIDRVVNEQSQKNKYYVVANDYDNELHLSDALALSKEFSTSERPLKVLHIKKGQFEQNSDKRVRGVFASEQALGNWLANTTVNNVIYETKKPHILFDRNHADWEHFLSKNIYSSNRFTYSFFDGTDQLNAAVSKYTKEQQPVWVLASDDDSVKKYTKIVEKVPGEKVQYLMHGSTQLGDPLKKRIVFSSEDRRDIECFILNFYRRDKGIHFSSAVGGGQPVIVRYPGPGQGNMYIGEAQLKSWQTILNAKVENVGTDNELQEVIKENPNSMIYVISHAMREAELERVCSRHSKVKRIILDPKFNPRKLSKIESDRNKLYTGAYPAEITDYLRNLRYNIRNPSSKLRKMYKNEITELYIHESFALSERQLIYLQNRNDSLIINNPRFSSEELQALLRRAKNYNYNHIFIGDGKTVEAVTNFNKKNNTKFKVINAKASPLIYTKSSPEQHVVLETHEADEYLTYLYNLPQKRYHRAKGFRDILRVYVRRGRNNKVLLDAVNRAKGRNTRIELYEFDDPKQLVKIKENIMVLMNPEDEENYIMYFKKCPNIKYFLMNDVIDRQEDKDYSSGDNYHFVCRKDGELASYMANLPVETEENYASMNPIAIVIKEKLSIVEDIMKVYQSSPLPNDKFRLNIMPPFINDKNASSLRNPPSVVFLTGGVINACPSVKVPEIKPSRPLPSISIAIIDQVKKLKLPDPVNLKVLDPGLESDPAQTWVPISSQSDPHKLPPPQKIPQSWAELQRVRRENEAEEERRKMKVKQAQIQADRLEYERVRRLNVELEERERMQRAERERKEKLRLERVEAERLERIERERAQKERVRRLELERIEIERVRKMQFERQEEERQRRMELDRLEAERQKRIDMQRIEAERTRRLQEVERLKRLQMDREEAERIRRMEAERQEAERIRRIEMERLEAERLRRIEAERQEAERLKRLEFERMENERIKRLQMERAETDRLRKIELDRQQADRLRRMEIERQQAEFVRLEMERQNAERMRRLDLQREESERLRVEFETRSRQTFNTVIASSKTNSAPNLPKLAVVYPDTPDHTDVARMLKSNLEPDQYITSLLSYKTPAELESFTAQNGARLSNFDKSLFFMTPEFEKHEPAVNLLKDRSPANVDNLLYDEDFNEDGYRRMANLLPPFKIRQVPLPWVNQYIPRLLFSSNKLNLLVPENLFNQYAPLAAPTVEVESYSDPSFCEPYLHKPDEYLIIVTDKLNFNQFKYFPRMSPRCSLLVDSDQPLYEDELQLSGLKKYSLSYGAQGQEYVNTLMTRLGTDPSKEPLNMLYYHTDLMRGALSSHFREFEKVPYTNFVELYQHLIYTYAKQRSSMLIPDHNQLRVVPIQPKVYLQNVEYMRDFKNLFKEKGYLNEEHIRRKSQVPLHQFADLQEVYYSDAKDLQNKLAAEPCPGVVLVNSSNPTLNPLRARYKDKHKFLTVTNNSQRWIHPDGMQPEEVTDNRLKKKQDMFAAMFNAAVFDLHPTMQYYYLSNVAQVDKQRNIMFRSRQELLQIYRNNPNQLMVLFAEAKDEKYIPEEFIDESQKPAGRVKLILLAMDFVDHPDTLFIKHNEIDPVIYRINVVKDAGRINYALYNAAEGERTRQSLIQKGTLRAFDNCPYKSIHQVEELILNIKGKISKLFVICLPNEEAEIRRILTKLSISSILVSFHIIDRPAILRPSDMVLKEVRPSSRGSVLSNDMDQLIQEHARGDFIKEKSRSPKGRTRRYSGASLIEQNVVVEEITEVHKVYETIKTITQKSIRTQIELDSPQATRQRKFGLIRQYLAEQNLCVYVDEGLAELFPHQQFPGTEVVYFRDAWSIPAVINAPQMIISNNRIEDLQGSSQDRLGIMISNSDQVEDSLTSLEPDSLKTLVLNREYETPELIQLLAERADFLAVERRLFQYSLVYIVYDDNANSEDLRRVLALAQKHEKVVPTLYSNNRVISEFLRDPKCLVLILQSNGKKITLDEEQDKQNFKVLNGRRFKAIRRRRLDLKPGQLDTIDEVDSLLQESPLDAGLQKMDPNQIKFYLKLCGNMPGKKRWHIFENSNDGRNQGKEGKQFNIQYNLPNAKINKFKDTVVEPEEIEHMKTLVRGDLIVLLVEHSKVEEVTNSMQQFNVLIQSYTNSMNMEIALSGRRETLVLAIIDESMLDKVPNLKRKYPNVYFLLEGGGDLTESMRGYIAGVIDSAGDIDSIVSQIYGDFQKQRFAENERRNSVDGSQSNIRNGQGNKYIHDKFAMGVRNTPMHRLQLYFKDPNNLHVKLKLANRFPNITFIGYRTVEDLKRLFNNSGPGLSSLVIMNGTDIEPIEDFFAHKKRDAVYLIRFDCPYGLPENPRVKQLYETQKQVDLEDFLLNEFQKNFGRTPEGSDNSNSKSRSKSRDLSDKKRYTQRYAPTTFGTTTRFTDDYVPSKSRDMHLQKTAGRLHQRKFDPLISPRYSVHNNFYKP